MDDFYGRAQFSAASHFPIDPIENYYHHSRSSIKSAKSGHRERGIKRKYMILTFTTHAIREEEGGIENV